MLPQAEFDRLRQDLIDTTLTEVRTPLAKGSIDAHLARAGTESVPQSTICTAMQLDDEHLAP